MYSYLFPTFIFREGGYRDEIATYGLISGLWSSMYSLGSVETNN